ncbi:MAG TPA: 30S ribosomal protein S9 [Candidatus Limnocylindria bacterium]|nr:30S ribosomal protein S9 [Candidatus Limnocylindria bacterium]
MATAPAYNTGTGRRKTAVARVRLMPGDGEIVINGRSFVEHFGAAIDEAEVRMPFRVTNTDGRYNAMVKVEGGGVTGQGGAVRQGIARALLEIDPDHRLALRQAGYLTRDPRMKERKKFGLKRARKAPQYTKR